MAQRQIFMTHHLHHALCALALSVFVARHSGAAEQRSKVDPRYPFRTDFANEHLPWYQLRPGEFPPSHSEHRVSGELVEADFIHRAGAFRDTRTGALVRFTLPPFGVMRRCNAPADLRDVPLGTHLLFFLYQDENGDFTRLADALDDFTVMASHSSTYRLNEVKLAEGKLLVTKQSLPKNQPDQGKSELAVTAATRVWRGEHAIKLYDLACGDCLLVNLTGRTAVSRGWCSDIWVGEETHRQAEATQRARHAAFEKERGLPVWIDRVEGQYIIAKPLCANSSATRKALQTLIETEFPTNKAIRIVIANDELRTYNPPVDKMRAQLLEVQRAPSTGHGNSGLRLVLQPVDLLEGFRRGRVIRLFPDDWPMSDMPWGEALSMQRVHPSSDTQENIAREIPAQFPYRTDYGNAHLPWYRLEPGVVPPPYSAHVVIGELVRADGEQRTGQFRDERSGELVNFSLTKEGAAIERIPFPKKGGVVLKREEINVSVLYRDAEASLAEIPLGTRCRFHLYQDEQGSFNRASLVLDEYSYFALNHFSYRVEAADLDKGQLQVARQIPPSVDYHERLLPVPPLGRTILFVNGGTRIWKNAERVKPADLTIGDVLLVNQTGDRPGRPAHCTEIWIAAETSR